MFLLSNPFKPVGILAVYLYFVLHWGPKFMERRKAFKLDNVIKCYNLLQVAVCSWITIKGYYHSFGQGYSLFCQPVDYSTTNHHAVELTKMGHLYFLSKVVDLFDTIFFVLKKKQTHVSFLHVYHHAGMVLLSWMGLKYFSGGHSVFMGVINSFVHVIMYLYYFMTSIDNRYKQSSWKKYITQLQMVSFTEAFVRFSLKYFFAASIRLDGAALAGTSLIARLWLPKMGNLLHAPTKLFHFHFVLRFLSKNLP